MKEKSIKFNWLIKLILCCYLIVPFSCEKFEFNCSHSCCGESFDQEYSIIDSMSITTGKIISYKDNGYNRDVFEQSSSNSYATAALRIDIVGVKQLSFEYKPKFNFSLMSTAYACSPPEANPTQRISSIRISSDKTINDNGTSYKPGEDLSVFFEIVPEYDNTENMTFEEFINKQQGEPSLFGSYSSGLTLKLNKQLTVPENILTITMNFDDDSEFILSTEEFSVN